MQNQSKFAEKEGQAKGPQENTALKLVSLLGKHGTRNYLLSLRMGKDDPEIAPRKKDAKTKAVAPENYIKHAILIEEFCQDRRIPHAETAWIIHTLTKSKDMPKLEPNYIKELWDEAFKTAQIANNLGKQLTTFSLDKYAFAGGIVIQLGKLLMNSVFPKSNLLGAGKSWADYSDMRKKFITRNMSLDTLLSYEKRSFYLTHSELSSFALIFSNRLRTMEKAVRFYLEPYFLADTDPDQYILAVILSTATRLATLDPGKPLVLATELPLTSIHRQWLASIGLNDESCVKALKAVRVITK
jgi:hypothetical protein